MRSQTESIREFILDRVAADPRGVARRVAEAYRISRQAANRHLDALVGAGLLEQAGHTRAKEYRLLRGASLTRELRVTPVLKSDRLWDDHIAPLLAHDRPSVRDLCHGAFDETMRNAIAHAAASWITFSFSATARHLDLTVSDDGHGLFAILARRIGAASPRDAAEEMARHARMRSSGFPGARLALLARNFETFAITSSGVSLVFDANSDLWTVRDGEVLAGTRLAMRARRNPSLSSSVHERELAPASTS